MPITWSDRLKLAALSALSALLPLTSIAPAQAAERVYLEYGAFERSVSVQQLVDFAETGAITPELRLFLGRFSPEQRSQLRDVLRARYNVSASVVDSLSYSASGEQLLTEIGSVIRTQSRLNGLHSLRAAGILAAADADGLSILGFLRHLPTDMRIDVGELLQRFRQIRGVLSDTTQMTRAIEQEAVAIAAAEPATDFSQMPDLRQPGPYRFTRQTLTVDDPRRQRSLTVDLYLPSLDLPDPHSSAQPSSTQQDRSIPVIVVSNGLGARRDYFEELAAHLASYGLAIAIPDHPGSDREYLRGFFSGLYPENFDPSEFVERPRDITALLDDLERRNPSQFGDRLNLEQVGVFGYSFGGSTALSLGGATINVEHLEGDCRTQRAVINISLLYQCRALTLPDPSVSLRDERVKALFLYVPFAKSLFGPNVSQVDIPVYWLAANEDILTPLVVEQLPTFAQLTTPDRYLAVSTGLPHARVTFDVLERLTNGSRDWATLRSLTQTYQNTLSLAFFQTYVAQDETYRPYLQSAYAQQLAPTPFRLSVVRSLPSP